MKKENVANKTVTFQVPIIKFRGDAAFPTQDEMRESYDPGLYVFDNGISYMLVHFDGSYMYSIHIPREQMDKQIAFDAVRGERDLLAAVMDGYAENISNIGCQMFETINKLEILNDILVEVRNIVNVKSASAGSGVDILDVARSLAVIQRPELITELNK